MRGFAFLVSSKTISAIIGVLFCANLTVMLAQNEDAQASSVRYGGTFQVLPTYRSENWRALDWRPGSEVATMGSFGTETSDGQSLWKYDHATTSFSTLTSETHYVDFWGIDWRTDGSYCLIAGMAGYVYTYDGITLTPISIPLPGVRLYQDVAWRPDNAFALMGGDYYADMSTIVDKFDGAVSNLYTLAGGPFIHGVAWNPVATSPYYAILAADNSVVYRCDSSTSESIYALSGVPPGAYWDVSWRPQGDYALLAGSSVVKYSGTFSTVTSLATTGRGVAFSPDGSRALIVGDGGKAWEYVHATGQVTELDAGAISNNLWHITWRPDGSYALIVGDSGTCVKFTPITHVMTLSSGGVVPSSGYAGVTDFTYSVTYTDSSNHAPTTKNVYVDGAPHAMTTSDTTYTDGSVFTFTTQLGEGSHDYYFDFACSQPATARLPTSGSYNGPVIYPHSMSLSSGNVSPPDGTSEETYTYSVTYTDNYSHAPTTKSVYIDGVQKTMTTSDTAYEDGSIFTYSANLIPGSHDYYFYFVCQNSTYRLPSTGTYSGPYVIPHITNLTSGGVTPDNGETEITLFNYTVVYTDTYGHSPTRKDVVIDGIAHAMYAADTGYEYGSTFYFESTLPSNGTHNYYFDFACPSQSFRLPASGSYPGPNTSTHVISLADGDVSPDYGEPGATVFVYSVVYSDSFDHTPTSGDVVIDGTPYTMTTSDSDPSSGMTFRYQTILAFGSHNYYFSFACPQATARLPSSGTFLGPNAVPHDISLSAGEVSPPSGQTGITAFNYTVTYTDTHNDTPLTKNVVIDGNSHPMTPVGGSYAAGVVFYYSTLLGANGTHTYYFDFSCSQGTARLPVSGVSNGPSTHSMQIRDGKATPTLGETGITTFTYSVVYEDSDNHQPTKMDVYVDGVVHAMSTTDFNYADGSLFTYATQLSTTGNHTFYFDFACPESTDRLPDSGAIQGPSTLTHSMTLIGGSVSPGSGQTSVTNFTYSVTYSDNLGHPPSACRVYIDGVAHSMFTGDSNYVDGSVFSYSSVLPAGSHTYFFEFSCERGTTTLPVSGSYAGPGVNTPPVAVVTVEPTNGDSGTTFVANASGCTDTEDPSSSLEVRWDWKGDGTWTTWSTTKIADHRYGEHGPFTIKMEVRDTGGLISNSTFQVFPCDLPDKPANCNIGIQGKVVTISWQAPSDDGGSEVLYYVIYRDAGGGMQLFMDHIDASQRQFVDTTKYSPELLGTKTVYYEIRAVNARGESVGSNILKANIPVGIDTLSWLKIGALLGSVALTLVYRKRVKASIEKANHSIKEWRLRYEQKEKELEKKQLDLSKEIKEFSEQKK